MELEETVEYIKTQPTGRRILVTAYGYLRARQGEVRMAQPGLTTFKPATAANPVSGCKITNTNLRVDVKIYDEAWYHVEVV